MIARASSFDVSGIKRNIFVYFMKLYSNYKNLIPKAAFDIGQLLMRNIVLMIVGLLVTKVITSSLSREEYGMYQYALGIAASLAFMSLPGLKQVTMQEAAKGRHGILSRTLKIRIYSSILYSVLLLFVAVYYRFFAEQNGIAACFLVVSLVFPLGSAFEVYQSYLLGREQYGLYSRLPIITGLASAPVMALTAWYFKDPVILLAIMGLMQIFLNFASYRFAMKAIPPQNNDFTSSSLKFGMGLSMLNIMPSISAQLDTIIIGTMFTMSEVAVLQMASLPLDKSKLVINILGEFFSPKVTSHTGRALFKKANRTMVIYLSVVAAYILLVAAIIPIFFRLIFPNYIDVVPLAILAVCSMLASVPSHIMEMTLYAEERLKQTVAMRFIQFGFDIVIAFTAIKMWGIWGAFIGRFIAGGIRTGMVTFFYVRNHRKAYEV